MIISKTIPILHDKRLNVAWIPFKGEGNKDNPANFSGRCFWLSGEWEAVFADGAKTRAYAFNGDWPFLDLMPFIGLNPLDDARGFEISRELVLKYLFTVSNALDNYILGLSRMGYSITEDGQQIGKGNILRWGVDLSSIKETDKKRELFDSLLKEASRLNDPGIFLFELFTREKGSEKEPESLLTGRIDAKGEIIQSTGSILEHSSPLKLTGKPKEWHLRKIPGWPYSLQEGMPAVSAVIYNDEDWRLIYLLHRLYGKRFRNTLFIFHDSSALEFWRLKLHGIFKPTEIINKKIKKNIPNRQYQDNFLWPNFGGEVFLIPDFLWRSDLSGYPLDAVKRNDNVALFGWNFCLLIFNILGLKKKLWDGLFENFKILGKIPIKFPVKSVIDPEKWRRFWQKKVGDIHLEDMGTNIWTFYPSVDQWKAHGSLPELLSYHSLLPLMNQFAELESALSIYPNNWKKLMNLKRLEIPKRLAKWPIWYDSLSCYMQIQISEWNQ